MIDATASGDPETLAAPGLMKFVNAGSSAVTINELDTKTGASWGHSAAAGGHACSPPIGGLTSTRYHIR
ncbi:MAG: hypothetical protein ACREVJ_08440, partial [Gammaproteobacteria bacterium]